MFDRIVFFWLYLGCEVEKKVTLFCIISILVLLTHMCMCLFVRLFVCSLLMYRLTVFLPLLPEVGCQIFLEIRNSWGKVMRRSGLPFEHFCLEVV